MRSRIVQLGILSSIIASKAIAQPMVVAVVDLQVHGVSDFDQAKINKFSTILDATVASAGFRTIARSEIDRERIRREQLASYDPCRDEACQIDLGKALSASMIVRSVWSVIGSKCRLTVSLIDLRTETTEFATESPSASCTEDSLGDAIRDAGVQLRSRSAGGYGDFTLDLRDASNIKNPPTDQTGYLNVSARAKGRPDERITVFINGAAQGEVSDGRPFIKELPVGRYIVLLQAAGGLYRHEKHEFELSNLGVRIPREGTIELKPIFGELVIDGEPRDASAIVDGQPYKIVGGRAAINLRSGPHEVVIEAPGHLRNPPQKVRVESGETTRLSYRLERNAGTLHVSADVAAEVAIEGRVIGRVPRSVTLDVGTYRVEVRAVGHHPHASNVTISRGLESRVDAQLKPKRARLKIEGMAKLADGPAQLEADVEIDGQHVGTTPWKGEVLADVPHEVQLRMGSSRTDTHPVVLNEGEERRLAITTPPSWAGSTSALRFDLVEGPWTARFGDSELDLTQSNSLRPGKANVSLLLDGKVLAQTTVALSPGLTKTIRVTARPKTASELEGAHLFWNVRKWSALGATVVFGAIAGERLATAHRAQDDRDASIVMLRAAPNASAYDGMQADIEQFEERRASAQRAAIGLLTTSIALGVWALVEFLFLEPDPGELVGNLDALKAGS